MDLMARRRMMANTQSYITNGLVFHLDGINRGTTDTDKWVDLVGGKIFVTSSGDNATWGTNHLITPCEMTNADMMKYTPSGYTFEIVYRLNTSSNGTLFTSRLTDNNRSKGGYGFGLYNLNFILSNNTYNKITVAKTTMPIGSDYCASYSYPSTVVINGEQKSTGTADYYYCRADGLADLGKYDSGRIYSVRIYNRQLTVDEIVHNQTIDNKRFNLGMNL